MAGCLDDRRPQTDREAHIVPLVPVSVEVEGWGVGRDQYGVGGAESVLASAMMMHDGKQTRQATQSH